MIQFGAMTFELVQKHLNGEMPDDCYSVANSKAELVALIEQLGDACTITKDSPGGESFHFGMTSKGGFFFESGDEESPEYHSARFDTAEEGVEKFKFNGNDLFAVVKGRRFLGSDCPLLYD